MESHYEKALIIKGMLDDKIPELNLGLKSGKLYPFQRKGIIYMFAGKKVALCDSTGLGKTIQSLGLFLLLQKLKQENKWIIVVPSNALYQWESEFLKFTNFKPLVADGDPVDRIQQYMFKDFQFVLISYQTLWRDWEHIKHLEWKNFLFDDAHFFKHRSTETAKIVRILTEDAERVVLTTATPVQKTLMDLQSLLEVLGLNSVFGNSTFFKNFYCITQKKMQVFGRRHVMVEKIVGHQNMSVLAEKIKPYILKRTFEAVGKEIPDLQAFSLKLKLHPEQKKLYEQAKEGLSVEIKKDGKINLLANKGWHSLVQALAGTQTFGLEEDCSVKLDAIEFFIEEKLGEDKLIVYSFYLATLETLKRRLEKKSIKYLCITGKESSKEKEVVKQLFTADPSYKILLGSGAIEQSMNLQVGRYLIMCDLILNPARVVQLIGRLRRIGSVHKKIIVYFLLAKDTIEEKLWKKLGWESQITEMLFNEKSDVFNNIDDRILIDVLKET